MIFFSFRSYTASSSDTMHYGIALVSQWLKGMCLIESPLETKKVKGRVRELGLGRGLNETIMRGLTWRKNEV